MRPFTLLTSLATLTTSTLLTVTSHCPRDYYLLFTQPGPAGLVSTPVTIVNATQNYTHLVAGNGQQLGISDDRGYWTSKQFILGLNTETLGEGEGRRTRVWWNVNLNNGDPLANVPWNVTTTGLPTSAECGNATEYSAGWMHNCADGEGQVLGVHLCSQNA